jgi:putative addiction module component (TIGR02574 family)
MTEIKDILKLSVEERLHLVQTIWDSISGEAEESPVSDGHMAILNERLESYKKNPGNNVSWEEVKESAKKIL